MAKALVRMGMGGAMLLASGAAGSHPPRVVHGRQCIPLHAIRTETATDSHSLVFHMDGGAAFMSHLPAACDGLTRVNTVADVKLHPRGEDLCVGDAAEIVPQKLSNAVGLTDASDRTRCTLGPFEAITEMELPESLRR